MNAFSDTISQITFDSILIYIILESMNAFSVFSQITFDSNYII